MMHFPAIPRVRRPWAVGLGLILALAPVARGGQERVSCGLAPDGGRVAFVAADGNLYLLDLATRVVTSCGASDEVKSSPRFAPDGQTIVYSVKRPGARGNGLVIRAADGTVRPLTSGDEGSDITPSFSADGQRVVFARAYRNRPYSMGGMTWDQFEICTVNRDGCDLRRLTEQRYYQAGHPAFVTADRIVFAAYEGTESNATTSLFWIPADGLAPPAPFDRFQPGPGTKAPGAWATDPALAVDGKRLAFISDRVQPFQYDVMIADADGTNARGLEVTGRTRLAERPMLLPGDKGVLYLADLRAGGFGGPRYSLWSVPLAGGTPTMIADSKRFADPLGWTPPPEGPPAAHPPGDR